MMTYWVVPLDPNARTRLTDAELDLGSLQHHPVQGAVLTFRDRFVAMKIAARLGTRAAPLATTAPSAVPSMNGRAVAP